jgi:geranylgeranyl reductase family protein
VEVSDPPNRPTAARSGGRFDVAVVGAGPAGSAAAIELARGGLDVVVLDRATFPRDKICGDGLTTGALRQLEALGLDPSSVCSWQVATDCWVTSPSDVTVRFPLPVGQGQFAAIARRRDLDAALVELARCVGAEVREGTPVSDVRESDDGVVLDTPDGSIHARWCVAADGVWSPVRKFLGVHQPGYRGEWHAFRQYFRGVTGRAASDLFVRFDADLLPGYFWSFPLPDGGANVGYGIQRGGKVAVGDMGPLWTDLLGRPWARELLGDAQPEGPHRAWPIPARIDRVELGARRTMFVGDAAAACDTMTGEGIGQALLTGRQAARAVLRAGAGGDAVADYRSTVRADLVADHRMSALLVRALQHRKGARAAIRVAGATGWTRRNFARWLFEDYPRAVVVTPRRWRRGVFTSPGAYLDASVASDPSGRSEPPERLPVSP